LSSQNAFIEVDQRYNYTQSGVTYTCLCEKTSEYRYQLTCEGQRRRGDKSLFDRFTTTTPSGVHSYFYFTYSVKRECYLYEHLLYSEPGWYFINW